MSLSAPVKRALLWAAFAVAVGGVSIYGAFDLLEKAAAKTRQDENGVARHSGTETGTVPRLQRYGNAASFDLTERSGAKISKSDLDGRVWVVDFFFTSCSGLCLSMSKSMQGLQDKFKGDDRVRFVSITCDPKRDTLDVLREYAGRYGADPEQWLFLRGEDAEVQGLARDFKLSLEGVVHSDRFVLVDQNQIVRGFYKGTDPKAVAELEEDIATLLAEAGAQRK